MPAARSRAALASACCRCSRWPHAGARARAEADRRSSPTRTHRDHHARRALRGSRRQPAGRDGGRCRRHDRPHVGGRRRRRAPIPNWMVFALTNPTDKPIERWLTADRYNVVGSGAIWPDLDARRIEAVTPSHGLRARAHQERPRRHLPHHARAGADHHLRRRAGVRPLRAHLSCGSRSSTSSRSRDRQLFNGIMLGLTGLLAIFLTAIFAANHKLIFPACRAGRVVRAGLPVRRLRLLPQAVPAEARGQRRLSRRGRIGAGGEPRDLPRTCSCGSRSGTALIRMLITVWIVAQLSLIARGCHRSAAGRDVRAPVVRR